MPMKRIYLFAASMMLLVACGAPQQSDNDKGETTAVETSIVSVVQQIVTPEPDVESMTIEQIVDGYLARYAALMSRGDEVEAEQARSAMLEWLQSLSDEDKRRADRASEAWYQRNEAL